MRIARGSNQRTSLDPGGAKLRRHPPDGASEAPAPASGEPLVAAFSL